MDKLKENKKIVISLLGIVVLGVMGFFLLNGSGTSSTGATLTTITEAELAEKMEAGETFFVVAGEKDNAALELMKTYVVEEASITKNIYYLDTTTYTLNISDSSLSDEERETAINEYLDFMSTYKIDTLPTVIIINDGNIEGTSGGYLNVTYFIEETSDEDKAQMLSDANEVLQTYFN